MEFKERYLDEIAKFSQGIQVGIEKQYNKKSNGLVRFLRIVDYTQGGDDIRYIDMPSKNHMVSKEDIVMVRYGASAGFIGTGLEGIIANNMFKIEPNEHIDKRFLYYFLTQKRIKDFLLNKTTASAMPAINFGMLSEIAVPIIELDTQKKIVEVLDKAQELIDKRKEQIEAIDELVKSKFIEMFGDLYNNPKKWRKEKFGEIVTIERGGSPRPINDYITDDINGVNWIKIGDTSQNSMYIKSTKEKIKPEGIKKSRYVKEGDLLLSNSMSFGRPYILKTDGCIHDGWLVIRDDYNIFNKIYLCTALGTDAIYAQFKNMAVGGVVNNLNKDMVKELSICIPPIELQNQFADFINQVDKLKSQMETSLKELEDNFNSLMQKAFKGELF